MELAARIDALSIELEQRHEELKRHITQTAEHAIVPLLQHVERSAHFAPDVVAPPAADTWDDDDELLEGSVTQMVVTDVRPDA